MSIENTINSVNSINALSDVGNLVSNVVSQFVVRPTGSNLGGFIFDLVDDEEINLDADITDHYVEQNYAVQDHVALRPERFTLKGFVGELNDVFPQNLVKLFTNIQTVGVIMSPEFTTQATETYIKLQNALAQAGEVINQATSIYNIFTDYITTASRQQNAYYYFRNMWISRQLFSIETPFCVFTNMAIEKVTAIQRGQSNMVADFSVSFKHMRIINTSISTSSANANSTSEVVNLQNLSGGVFDTATTAVYSGRTSQMTSPTTYNGQISGLNIMPTTGLPVDVGQFSKFYVVNSGI